MIASINPADGAVLRTFNSLTDTEIEDKLARAEAAYRSYRRTSLAERARWLARAADILDADRDRIARIVTLEMGKPVKAAAAETAKCAWACRYYAEGGEQQLADEPVETGGARTFIRYQPIGAVFGIMPWNFPLWQVFRFAAPALMVGNVGLLKHASNVPQSALEIERVIRDAGFPPDVFQTLLIGSSQVSGIIRDPRIKAVTLTGSEAAGEQVAAEAGKQLKKAVLELGGSDPFVVMPSANLETAVAKAVEARTLNNGQSCIAAKRFIIHADIAAEFEQRFVAAMAALRVGDPMDESTQVGPLATPDILDGLHDQVTRSVQMGARLLCGGQRLDRPGNYYAPTVLADAPEDTPAFREELFGPVAALFTAKNMDHAIELANDSDFGLGACAWTNDEAERQRFIEELESGMVFINGVVASDPRLPFGGVKRSGFGRELGIYGVREFVNIKTVVAC